MPRTFPDKSINRIIDANLNRTKEGLRVCEEIARFILNSRKLTSEFKALRHQVDTVINRMPLKRPDIVKARDSLGDVGEDIYINELKRKNIRDIFFANMQRVKESVRVLEEFSKLIDEKSALRFKAVRYGIYEIEKEAFKKIAPLRDL